MIFLLPTFRWENVLINVFSNKDKTNENSFSFCFNLNDLSLMKYRENDKFCKFWSLMKY